MRRIAAAALFASALPLAAQDAPSAAERNLVDAELAPKWSELGLVPVARSGDAEFLRRVTLDLAGTLPEPEEVEEFLAETDPAKRDRKIDELLSSEAFADYWADRMVSWLLGYRDNKYPTLIPLKSWLKERLAEDAPYDRIVRELVTARGRNEDAPETAFVVHHMARDRTNKALTVQVSKVFLGVQMQCAQCHDHPFEPWKKDDFERMVAFFDGTQVRTLQMSDRRKDAVVEVVDVDGGGGGRRGRGARAAPRFIDGREADRAGARESLARMITSPENLQFARATVNRIWSELTGRGFVEPVDDFTSKNEPSLPGLLDALAFDFASRGFDLRRLVRTIARSEAYQRTSERAPGGFADEELARRAYAFQVVRPMTAEQLVNAFAAAQGHSGAGGGRRRAASADRFEQARRAAMRQFVLTSGSENAVSPSEYNASMQQLMAQLNRDSKLYGGVRARGGGRLARILRGTREPARIVRELYLATLSREPRAEELADCLAYIGQNGGSPQSFEDVFFVLLNTNEFFFNH